VDQVPPLGTTARHLRRRLMAGPVDEMISPFGYQMLDYRQSASWKRNCWRVRM